MALGLEVKKNNWPKLKKLLAGADRSSVAVGFPVEKDGPHHSGMSRVQVATLLQFGSPGGSALEPPIPARPFMDALIQEHGTDYLKSLGNSLRLVLGEKSSTRAELEKIGDKADDDLKWLFDQPYSQLYRKGQAGGWKMENAEYTKEQKGSDTPLEDTGELRDSISHVVRMRGQGPT